MTTNITRLFEAGYMYITTKQRKEEQYIVSDYNNKLSKYKRQVQKKQMYSLCYQIQRIASRSDRSTRKHTKRLLQAGRPKEIQQDTDRHDHLIFCRVRFYRQSITPRNSSTQCIDSPIHKNNERQTYWRESVPYLLGKK